MGKFLTSASRTEQVGRRKFKLLDNELYQDDDGSIYLVWRNYITDNFTWINQSEYDIRCSHIHDEGCQYHAIVKVNLSEEILRAYKYLRIKDDKIICEDIPVRFLKIIPVSGNWINNLFYRMLKDADTPPTPKHIQLLYRAGVSLNIKWFFKKTKLNLEAIYNS